MRDSRGYRLAALAFVFAFFAIAAAPAYADDFGQRFTIDVGPVFQGSTTGDANAPPPAGGPGVGYTKDNPIPNTLQLEYGLDFRIDKKTHLYYSHNLLGFAIGRVLTAVPHGALVSGEILDRFDTIGINHNFFPGFTGRIYYQSHQRQDVTGLCLNQQYCSSATGEKISNFASINEIAYAAGFDYDFGPKTRIGPLFDLSYDTQYTVRPSAEPLPSANLGGLGHWTGSQFINIYGIVMKLPVSPTPTFIPFVGVKRDVVLFRNEATPEQYNVTLFGIVKVVNKNLTLSITNINYSECRCSDTVPPPDNVRFAEVLLKADIKTSL